LCFICANNNTKALSESTTTTTTTTTTPSITCHQFHCFQVRPKELNINNHKKHNNSNDDDDDDDDSNNNKNNGNNILPVALCFLNVNHCPGTVTDEQEEARAYSVEHILLFGEFAYINVLQGAHLFLVADANSDEDDKDKNEIASLDDA